MTFRMTMDKCWKMSFVHAAMGLYSSPVSWSSKLRRSGLCVVQDGGVRTFGVSTSNWLVS